MTSTPRPATGARPQRSHQQQGRRRRPVSSTSSSSTPNPSGFQPNAVRTLMTPTAALVTMVDTFAELGVASALVDVLSRSGVTSPFPIQCATLPDSLAGRDVLGRGKTGSGKTLAFALPTVAALAASANKRQAGRPRALILVPTRELANQVAEVVAPLAAALSLKMVTIFGGVGQNPQVAALRSGVDIVVACPGRLEDLIQQRHCRLDQVEVTVLDEADHMADLGFLPVVRRLLDATPSNAQRLLFSATLDRGIDVLVQRFLVNPVVHSVDPEVAPVSTMTHHVFAVSAADKPAVVHALASGRERALLFMRTKHGAKKLAKQLTMAGIPAVELHGNLSQNARERNLEAFTEGTSKVLVATDIAARGIHVDDIALVVHVDPPAEHKAYLHRSGRTARAGAEGVVVTMMTPDQVSDVRALARAASIEPTITRMAPGHQMITSLVGEPAAYVKPSMEAAPQPRQGAPRGAGRPAGAGARRPQRSGRNSDQPRSPGSSNGSRAAGSGRAGGSRSR
jgi:superfamily II DNA/RNA helicase